METYRDIWSKAFINIATRDQCMLLRSIGSVFLKTQSAKWFRVLGAKPTSRAFTGPAGVADITMLELLRASEYNRLHVSNEVTWHSSKPHNRYPFHIDIT